MGYPVRYRKASRKYDGGGFQNPMEVPAPRRFKPANDNWPKPDNDNEPGGETHRPVLPEVPIPMLPPEDMVKRFLPLPVRRAVDTFEFAMDMWPNRTILPSIEIRGWNLGCGPV